mgnify:CR=1 FL=1
MDSFELRQYYAQLTGDDQNAFALREDGPEGYLYSDELILRAIEDIEGARMSDRPAYTQAMRDYGPQQGGPLTRMGLINSPGVAYKNVQEDLTTANEARKEGDYGLLARSLGSAAMQGVSPVPMRRMSAAMSLFDFLRGK